MKTEILDEQSVRNQAKADGVTHFATGIAVFQDNKLLIVRRVATDNFLGGAWELPGGGVDPGETIVQSAVRELLEETALQVDQIVGTFPGFDYATPTKPKVRQINFMVTVQPGNVRLEPTEHDDYRWITRDDLADLQATTAMDECLHQAFHVTL